ncbi:DUF4003 family protein [Solibacillus daqui]|uniref:DUF4003 family protein n=1 Tax=Solibacillus daqui TaxID=2912187 RepID=UPI002365015A|nr:DUF4003 family protein [Solibacillus daqui]
MDKNHFITSLQQNYERMSLFFSADITPAIKVPLAVQYTFSRETFHGIQFEAQMKNLQRKAVKQSLIEFFSTVSTKSVLSYKVAAHLILHDQTEQEIQRIAQNERYLEAAGFASSTYQSIAALFLIDEAHAKRAKQLHSEMKKKHQFLTGKDDIPYAVLLTREQADAKLQGQTMRRYYDALIQQDFKRGDALQAMSQLLTMYDVQFEPLLIDYVVAIRAHLKRENVKVRRNFYPFIAMLALTRANEDVLSDVMMLHNELKQLSLFALEPSLALMTATQFVLQHLIENDQLQQFNDSLLFLQALNMSNFLHDAGFTLAFDIFDLFI